MTVAGQLTSRWGPVFPVPLGLGLSLSVIVSLRVDGGHRRGTLPARVGLTQVGGLWFAAAGFALLLLLPYKAKQVAGVSQAPPWQHLVALYRKLLDQVVRNNTGISRMAQTVERKTELISLWTSPQCLKSYYKLIYAQYLDSKRDEV